MTTILNEEGTGHAKGARVDGESLWIPLEELEVASGWTLKPEGACRGSLCVPLPRGREAEFVRGAGPERSFDLAALARQRRQPLLRTTSGDVWSIGEASGDRRAALASLEAPDFELPDLDGRTHRLSDHRGKKVIVVSWASW